MTSDWQKLNDELAVFRKESEDSQYWRNPHIQEENNSEKAKKRLLTLIENLLQAQISVRIRDLAETTKSRLLSRSFDAFDAREYILSSMDNISCEESLSEQEKKFYREVQPSQTYEYQALLNAIEDKVNSEEFSYDIDLILRTAKRKLYRGEYNAKSAKSYILGKISDVELTPGKKLNDSERKFWHSKILKF